MPTTGSAKVAPAPVQRFGEVQKRKILELSRPDSRQATVGQCMVLVNLSIALRWPEHYWIIYLGQVISLLPLRYCRFRRKKEELLLLDWCYFVTFLNAIWLFVSLLRYGHSGKKHEWSNNDINLTISRVLFSLSSGSLLWSVPIFNNAVVYHSIDHLTSLFIHLGPAILFFSIRHGAGKGPGTVQKSWPGLFRICRGDGENAMYRAADACSRKGWCTGACSASVVDLIIWPIFIWVAWAVPYFVIMFIWCPKSIERRGKETLYSYIIKDKYLSRTLTFAPERPVLLRPILYLGQHFLAIITLSASTMLLWHSFWINFIVVIGILFWAFRNGSLYMFHYFALRYAEKKLAESSFNSISKGTAEEKSLDSDGDHDSNSLDMRLNANNLQAQAGENSSLSEVEFRCLSAEENNKIQQPNGLKFTGTLIP